MNIEVFREYCLSKKGATEDFPFDEKTLVFKVMGKIFALTDLDITPAKANLKCDPEKSIELREMYPNLIYPGYHMNKKHWNTVEIEGDLPHQFTEKLIDRSYNLVVKGLTKKMQASLKEL